MCDHFLVFPQRPVHWNLYALDEDNQAGALLPRDGAALTPGRFVVLDGEGQYIHDTSTTEKTVRRIPTPHQSSSRLRANQRHFRNTLRLRDDGRCAISGLAGAIKGDNEPDPSLRAAHIYSVARHEHWRRGGMFAMD